MTATSARLLLTTLLLLACSYLSRGQVNQSAFSSLLKEFESPKLYVNAIQQDDQGFIWFGTYKGLFRFDGVSYQRFLPFAGNSHSISDNEINVIFKDSHGNLWVGTRNGLNRYDYLRNDFERFFHDQHNPNSLCSNEVFAIAEDSAGNLWIGTLNGGLSIMVPFVASGVTSYSFINCAVDPSDKQSLSGNTVSSICFDHAGRGFIATKNGLNVVKAIDVEQKKVLFQHVVNDSMNRSTIASNDIYKIFCDSDNNIWLTSQFGMIDLLPATNVASGSYSFRHFFNDINSAAGGTIKSTSMLYKDHLQNYWLSTYENGLYRFRITPQQTVTDMVNFRHDPANPRSLSDGGVNMIYESRDHSCWFATDAGVSKWNPLQELFAVTHINASFLQTTSVSAIDEDKQGIIWLATSASDTLYAWMPQSTIKKLVLSDKSLAANRKVYVTSLLAAGDGSIYAGSSVGVFVISPSEKNSFLQQNAYRPRILHLQKNGTSSSLISNMVSCLEEDTDGIIWIGTGMGVCSYQPASQVCSRVLINKVPDEVNPSFIIRHLKTAADGTLWVATDNGLVGVNTHTAASKRYLSNEALPGSRFLYIHESHSRQLLWIGTEQGLLSFDPKTARFASYPQSGDDLAIAAILEDNQQNLWVSTQHGIFRFDPAGNNSTRYTEENGLSANRFSENVACATMDGRFFFGSEKGFQSFYPDQIPVNKSVPPIVITDFRLFNQSILSGKDAQLVNDFLRTKKLTLRYNQNFCSIDFAALNFDDADANTYAYQMEGIDQDWVMAGNNRTATYTNISPGCYTFKVKGANNHGVWNEAGTSLLLVITPPWWKTWWFYAISFIAASSALYALYRYRINQIKKVFSIRSKIARDLHDDIGSTLSSISLMSQLAKDGSDHPNKEQELFETISTASKEAMELMSVIVWSVNPNNDKLSNILIRMREYAGDILEACNINLHIRLDDEVKDFIIPMEKRKDFYLIFKEAVNNVAKYSKAENATIHLTKEHGKMIMTIHDDGQGFEVEKLRSGNGLVNMQERAKSIGGKLEISSQQGEGTTVRLEMPVVTG